MGPAGGMTSPGMMGPANMMGPGPNGGAGMMGPRGGMMGPGGPGPGMGGPGGHMMSHMMGPGGQRVQGEISLACAHGFLTCEMMSFFRFFLPFFVAVCLIHYPFLYFL